MKTLIKFCRYGLAMLLLLGAISSASAVNVIVDSSKTWIGFMNVSELPANGGAYQFGSYWGTTDLNASFSSAGLTLTPNTSIDRDVPNDAYWWVGGAGGAPNKNMDASMYVQDDTLAGQTVTFSGNCVSNTLVSPYTVTVFIKDFAPDFSSFTTTTATLTTGTAFSITLATTAGDHIQYGFETIGPDARLATVATLGKVIIAVPSNIHVLVDPSKTWLGYMNVFELPANGGGYAFGSSWGTADLNATFSAGIATLTPNSSIFRDVALSDTFWWQGSGAGNKNMDANFYVEDSSLAGSIVTFSGFVWTNSLVSPYTSQAFIKELDPSAGYATVNIITTNLTSTNFSITTATTAGHIVQYGFETVGPNANTTSTPLSTLGKVLVASNAPPTGPLITSLPSPIYVNVSSNVSITVGVTGSGLSYQWKKNGVNLSNGSGVSGATTATLSLNNVQGSAEANYSVVITDSLARTATGNSYLVVFTPSNLSFDPNATLNGFINAFYYDGTSTPGGYATGFGYPTALLQASISGGIATLRPNTSLFNNSDAFWSDLAGGPNKWVEADYYIANDDLAGKTLTFSGYCPSNSVDASFTPTAWITAFAPDYSSSSTVVTNLIAGQAFSITLATSTGTHIQYGLRMFGLDYPPGNPLAAGATLVTVVPPTMTASRSAGVTSISFPSMSGHAYTVQYKNNLTDSTWQTLTSTGGTGATVSVTDNASVANRFYRLSVQ